MSYTLGKNIKLNKKENKISGNFASSNVVDYNDKHIYSYVDDLYSSYEHFDDKKALFFYDIICGNLHYSKYKILICQYDNFKEFCKEIQENIKEKDGKLGNIYAKYENDIKSWFVENCIIKEKYNDIYIKRINKKTYNTTLCKDKAKKFSRKYLESIKDLLRLNNWEIEEI